MAITALRRLRWSMVGVLHSWNTQQEHAGPHGGHLSIWLSFVAEVQAAPNFPLMAARQLLRLHPSVLNPGLKVDSKG